MRVLLFVQTGDARPKCAKSFGDKPGAVGKAKAYLAAIPFGEEGQPERGWSVYCHNADYGRTCVEAAVAAVKYGLGPSVHYDHWIGVSQRHGRILASGGKP